jgi:hypothetical protein
MADDLTSKSPGKILIFLLLLLFLIHPAIQIVDLQLP